MGSRLVLADRVHGAPTQPERRAVAQDRGGPGQTEPRAEGGRRSLRQPGMTEKQSQLVTHFHFVMPILSVPLTAFKTILQIGKEHQGSVV